MSGREESVRGARFARAGVAALSDLQAPEWHELFALLEADQDSFLAHEPEFRSPEYAWPRDALHNWSRRWEYPAVYQWLRAWRGEWTESRQPTVIDVGSGVTFFPFAVAKTGMRVVCADVDPVCERDLTRAAQVVEARPGSVEAVRTAAYTLPFGDAEVDGIYCVSVLEHVADVERFVRELARVLRPRGPLFLTLDLDLREEGWGLDVAAYERLRAALFDEFDLLFPEVTTHPADVLASDNAPEGFGRLGLPAAAWFHAKQQVLKPLLQPVVARRRYRWPPFRLAVAALPLRKR